MKAGGGYNRYTKNQQIFGNTNGIYTFSDGWDKDKMTPTGVLTGDSYLDLLGQASQAADPRTFELGGKLVF